MTRSTFRGRLQHQAATGRRNAVLVISPFDEDHIVMGQFFDGSTWRVSGVSTCGEALEILPTRRSEVIICEGELPDGNWKDVLEALLLQRHPAPLLVTSRLADERLWAEVLHRGGSDVLAKPLDKREVLWAVNAARQEWDHRRREPITRVRQAGASTGP